MGNRTSEWKETDCLSCTLPECIPDHPSCVYPSPYKKRIDLTRAAYCLSCTHSTLIITDNAAQRWYLKCDGWDTCTVGRLRCCSRYHKRETPYSHTHKRKEKTQ
jgi:hypothetical protein